ncbi:MAG: beta-propeller fold lactonase family protein [Solirubrobacterales bacterium]|nr:beta-propeller fold lactonase family protein [Solirubrobacterales bacterium]
MQAGATVSGVRRAGRRHRAAGLGATWLAAVLAVLLVPTAGAQAKGTVYVSGVGSDAVAALGLADSGWPAPIPASPFGAGGTPEGVAVSPDGRRLYVANDGSDNVSGFSIGADGALTELAGSPFAAGDGPSGIAVSPDGRRLYVANDTSDDISGFSIGPGGSLTELAGSPFAASLAAEGIAASPDGRHVYVANRLSDDVSGYAVAADGSLSELAGSPFAAGNGPLGVAATPDDRRLYVANLTSNDVSGYAVAADGSLSELAGSPFAAGLFPRGIAAGPDGGRLYVANFDSNEVSSFAVAADGSLAELAGSPFAAGNSPQGIAASPDGRHLYVSNTFSDDVSGYAVAADGSLAELAGSPFAAGVAFPSFQSLVIRPNQGPRAAATARLVGALRIGFDARASSDPDGAVTGYAWSFGDGHTLGGADPAPTHAYAAPGTYTATLRVTDDEGCSNTVVYTGQTASCNGSNAAVTRLTVVVPPPLVGVQPPPARDTRPPGLRLSGERRQRLGRKVKLKASVDEPARVCASGRLVIKKKGKRRAKRLQLRAKTKTLAPGEKRTLKLRLSRRTLQKARRAVGAKHTRVRARLKISATDPAGNRARARRTVKLRGGHRAGAGRAGTAPAAEGR